MKIVLTGGHLTPAYAFAEHACQYKDELLVIGSEGSNSLEANELAKLTTNYQSIRPVKYDRHHRLISLLRFPLLILSFIQARSYLKTFCPHIVVTFGSFNAIPVALAAWSLSIPFIIHEQTKTVGLANKILTPFASAIASSYSSNNHNSEKTKNFVTGNLLRHAIWSPPEKLSVRLSSSKPIIYVTGGNQGSQAILRAVTPLIDEWKQEYQLVIQCGKTDKQTINASEDVCIQPWFSTQDASWLLHHAHIVISRGGANTIAELMVAGVPTVVVPLPNSSGDEQTKNALLITHQDAGIMLPQSDLNAEKLKSVIATIERNYNSYKQASQKLRSTQDKQAVHKLYALAIKKNETPMIQTRRRLLFRKARTWKLKFPHLSLSQPESRWWIGCIAYLCLLLLLCIGPFFRVTQFSCKTNIDIPCPDFIVPELRKYHHELIYLLQTDAIASKVKSNIPEAQKVLIVPMWPNQLQAIVEYQLGFANLSIPASSSAFLVSKTGTIIAVRETPNRQLPIIIASSAADLIISDTLTDPSLTASLEIIKSSQTIGEKISQLDVISPQHISVNFTSGINAVFTSQKPIQEQVLRLQLILSQTTINLENKVIDLRYDRPALKQSI